MCTGLAFKSKDFYFGRNLDLSYSFGQRVVITPREYEIKYKHFEGSSKHYAMIGMATIIDDYPLYAEGINEKGLGMAGLNFNGFADYSSNTVDGKNNITAYEIILWTLANFSTVKEARKELENINIMDTMFKTGVGTSPLHWIVADKDDCIVLEMTKGGVSVFDNPTGVLTNNPTFDYHLMSLRGYMGINKHQPENTFSDKLNLKPLGVGFGGIGLPGDYSPNSRFIKASFLNLNLVREEEEEENVSQFFHILDGVAMPKGAVLADNNDLEYTIYSCCANASKGIFYYKTYEKLNINKICMFDENLDSSKLIDKGYN